MIKKLVVLFLMMYATQSFAYRVKISCELDENDKILRDFKTVISSDSKKIELGSVDGFKVSFGLEASMPGHGTMDIVDPVTKYKLVSTVPFQKPGDSVILALQRDKSFFFGICTVQR